ncbi:helix-turn-helix domain protein [mine drainage metagenome]|uniref:Helix-turn-helix domain protein n=1 Tax=mine drainage metagenome TaxID=410659 RepID=A0A1J5QL57_9ZZZZ
MYPIQSRAEQNSVAELWTLGQAADYIGLTERSLRRYIADGDLPAYRLAGKKQIRVRRSDVEALLKPIPA